MSLAQGAGSAVAAQSPLGAVTNDELRSDVFRLRATVVSGGRIGIRTGDGLVVAAAMCALDGFCGEVHLLGTGVTAPESLSVLQDDDLVRSEERSEPVDQPPQTTSWVVYTSGTTGEPKPIVHTLETLTRTAVRSETAAGLRWGLLYDPTRMAGLQVVGQSLLSGAFFFAPERVGLAERVAAMVENGVNALSATPTLWRMILQTSTTQWPLEQITLGGEIADQHVLDALRARFPEARIVHVFASTETGAAFSVRDGRAGFPVAYLSEPPRGVVLEIRDDILHVLSPGVSVAGPDGFASTGDVVEIVDDRVHFKGRASGVVNVGGTNVWPEEVENLLRSHPDVRDASVWAVPNAMAGNLLMASVVLDAGTDPAGMGKGIRMWMKERAANTHVPAKVQVVDQIAVAESGKAHRQ